MSKGHKSLTKNEVEFLISLVRSLKSDLISYKAVGVKVPEAEHKKVSKIEKRLEVQLACLSS
jgi:hypothetical protein